MMYSRIFTKTLWERRKSIFFWSLGIFIFALMMGLLYPSIGDIEGFEALANDMPEVFQALVGEMGDLTSPTGFLGAELFNLMLPLTLSILAIGFGASAIAREEDSGTLELLLSAPVSRVRILLEKAAALVVNVAVVSMGNWAGVALASVIVDINIDLTHVFAATLAAALLAIGFGMVALMITALGWSRGIAVGIVTIIFIVSYFSNTLAVLIDQLEFWRNFSLLHYYDGQGVLEGDISLTNFSILVITPLVAVVVAAMGFVRRDTGA